MLFAFLAVIGPAVLQKKINAFLSPFEWKKRGPLIEYIFIPCVQEYFVRRLIGIGLVALEKMLKMWKVHNNNENNDENNNNDGQQTNYEQESSLELSVQVS